MDVARAGSSAADRVVVTAASAVPAASSMPSHRYGAPNSPLGTSDVALNGLVALVAERFGCPHAELVLVSTEQVWLRAAVSGAGRILAPDDTICAQVVAGQRPIVIPDARNDPRFSGHSRVVPAGGLRFYAGVPLTSSDGTVFGALCAWDSVPHRPSRHDIDALEQFGRYAGALLELPYVAGQLDLERAVASATSSSMDLILGGADLGQVLNSLAIAVETAFEGTQCSLLLLDGRQLRHGAAPSLPAAYRTAIDGVTIGPSVGSCGTAAFTGQTVIVGDIATDPRWDDYRDVALPFGLRACWSVPIPGALGQVLGTFALYYGAPREPTDEERRRIAQWVHLAGFAIGRARDMDALRQAATLDPLTGLINRTEVTDRLRMALIESTTTVAVLFVDLDQFKFVNDTFGHAVADQFLLVVAERLAGAVGPGDTVSRFGGDEFVLLCPAVSGAREAQSLARRVVEILRWPISIDGQTLSLSASVGVAVHPLDGFEGSTDLIGNADLAMYAAKRAGRNSVAMFTPGLRAQAADRLSLEADLALALVNDEMDCAFQPMIDLRTGRLVDVEVVLRWNSVRRGYVPPMTFIPVAEESGLIVEVGEFVLRRACEQLAAWRAERPGWSDVSIWVNVSPRQLRVAEFPSRVQLILAETGLPAAYLGLEVTESTLVADPASARSSLLRLRAAGVRIAIDDFGTGYSSLAQLRHLPVDVLKIDRQFIADLDGERSAAGIVEAIITLARTMNLQVVAEGIETAAQLDRLLEMNCAIGQGYLFAHPKSVHGLTALVDSLPRDPQGRPVFWPPR
ncbi:diguanylate cyclase (GGDEF)-like protein [Nakamurella sp. UYEF19]|uniref:putative bifunctional diguanylate cyclase/phosphodiesterase n=1 Tax=Nakamurella sp. UYEF19 TaxID=1756392 RepID=UPI0033915C2F